MTQKRVYFQKMQKRN